MDKEMLPENVRHKAPPLGLLPRWRHIEMRIADINDAVQRYQAENVAVPPEWINEGLELVTWLEKNHPGSFNIPENIVNKP